MKLWLDDVREPGAVGWAWAKTAADAIDLLKTGEVTEASLDHDLGICDACLAKPSTHAVREACPHNGTGYDVVCWMEEHGAWPVGGVTVHSANPVGAARMLAAISRHYS